MNDPHFMGIMQSLGDLRYKLRCFSMREAFLTQQGDQIFAVHELGYDVTQTLGTAPHVVDRDDLRMIQIRNRAGLLQVGCRIFGPGDMPSMRHFDGDEPVELFVPRLVNHPKPPLTQDAENAISTDA